MIEEKVEVAKDDGHKHRWAVGKWVYRREGGKHRLNGKALMWIVAIVFSPVMLFGLLKESEPSATPIGNSVAVPDQVATQQTVIDIKWTDFVKDTPKPDKPASNGPIRKQSQSEVPRFIGLQKVKSQVGVEIPPGTMVKARLMSGASDGPTRAILTEDLSVAGEIIAELGTMLVGQGSSSEERLMVPFSYMVFKDGSQVRIEAQACDESDKMPGLKGSNARGKALKLTGAIGLGVVGGVAMGYQSKQNQASGPVQPSMRDAVLNGVAVATLEQARAMTSDIQSTKPLYEVPEGTIFYVLFAGGK